LAASILGFAIDLKQLICPNHNVKQPGAIRVGQLLPHQQKFRRLRGAFSKKASRRFPDFGGIQGFLGFRQPPITASHEVVHAQKS
jgi:hypothetical protein